MFHPASPRPRGRSARRSRARRSCRLAAARWVSGGRSAWTDAPGAPRARRGGPGGGPGGRRGGHRARASRQRAGSGRRFGALLPQELLDLGHEVARRGQLVARPRRRGRILLALLRLLALELLDIVGDLRVLRNDLLEVLLELLRGLLEVR